MHRHGRSSIAALWLTAVLSLAPELTIAGAPALRLAYADWSSSVASAQLVCAVLRERLNRDCEANVYTADRMWEAVATGAADAMLSAWLPYTHADYMAEYGAKVRDLGPNFEGTRIGLVVPAVQPGRQTGAYGKRARTPVEVYSIPELAEYRARFNGRIVGIDPEAGIMRRTREALQRYDLKGYRLIEGSEAEMTRALSDAIRRQEPIVVTGWIPHWMFGRWSLRLLEDPLNVYGPGGKIHTLVRPGLQDELPVVYRFLDAFSWTPAEIEQLMVWIEQDQGRDPYAQALRWLRAHPERVAQWLQ
jgi:glycine betaine/proline transport system substrate-binding protein